MAYNSSKSKAEQTRRERKPHSKSRNGCTNCKQRHVKCDERGPPCANCIVRESTSTCKYGPGANPSAGRKEGSRSRSNSSELQNAPPRFESPSKSSAAFESRRLLELELMHQWTISTYKGLCSTPLDDYSMQVEMPRWCLEFDFLLNGVFAISALEIALVEAVDDPERSAMYIQAAMEYYDKGSATFRSQLGNINQENSTALYMFSSLAWIIVMAIPNDQLIQPDRTILQRVLLLMDLIMGSSLIAISSVAWIMDGPLSASMKLVLESFMQEDTAETALDPQAQEAFARLTYLADSAPPSPNFSSEGYQTAIVQLRLCFREEMKGRIKGSSIAFPSLAGQGFAAAVNCSEPLAMLILMYWAVMLEKLDRVDNYWWGKFVGRDLVLEISEGLFKQPQYGIVAMPEFWKSVAWVRESVGLPVL